MKDMKKQQGFASIVIVLTLVLILALTAVGFAQLARHEQQQALNKQLATQAYYAAETGVNDTVKGLIAGTVASSNTCGAGKTIDAPSGVSYTCVLVNKTPVNLSYDVDAGPGSERVVLNSSSAQITRIKVSWSSTTGRTGAAASISASPFPTTSNWNSNFPAVIQLGVTPLISYDRASLVNNTFTTFLYPSSSGGAVTYGAGGQGQIIGGSCSSGKCSVDINSITAANSVLINFINIYDKSNVVITAYDTSGTKLALEGAQAVVDVTGKAQDVLKRLQVRVPLGGQPNLPNYAIEAQNICKRMVVAPVSADNPNGTTFYGTTSSGTSGTVNALPANVCNLSN